MRGLASGRGTNSRVLLLVPDLEESTGGIARHARLLWRALEELGCDVSVLALNGARPGRHASQASLCESHSFDSDRRAFVTAALARMASRPGLVIAEHPHFSHLAWASARAGGARAVVVCHGIECWRRLPYPLRRALRASDRAVCVSQFTADRLSHANGIPDRQIRVLPSCLPAATVAVDGTRERSGEPRLLTVSRVSLTELYKGHSQVIAALPALLKRYPRLVYDVVGTGDGVAYLRDLTRRFGVDHAVRFHGALPDDELVRRYTQASLFVMPSSGEGFGFAFVEAMAHGLPVVAGDRDAAREVVADGQTGLLVSPDSCGDVATAIARLLGDHALRARMSSAAQLHVRTRFSFEGFRSRVNVLLRELALGVA
ncbi:MAG TPA: glycosyltransferase family 4 protein [Chloroflexota bacterium]|nr:glycosyltransferase family 4 protein [Chloroflexota bacterium]